MGPSSGLAAVAASAVATAGLTDPGDVATFVAGLTLVSGLLFLLLAVLKMGWIAQFLSRAVVTGFLFGAAIDVVIGELPKITGTDAAGSNSFQELRSWLGSLGETHARHARRRRRVARRGVRAPGRWRRGCPARWSSSSAGCSRRTCSTSAIAASPWSATSRAGSRRSSIPSPSLMLDHAGTVAVAAVALMLIGFSQTAGDARAFAAKHRYQIDVNQESVAQSAANIGSGVLHGMPVSTSLSASSLNDHSGAQTGLASITSGVTVLLTLLFLAPLFSQLPKPVLGALIIEAVVMGMMNLPEMRRIYRVQQFDFWVAIAAIIGTLAFGVLAGVIIGIGLSLLWLVAVATHPRMPVLGREPGTQVFRDVVENPDDEQIPGVVVLRLDGGLFFATADALEDRVRALIQARRRQLRGARLRGNQLPGLQGSAIDRRSPRAVPSGGRDPATGSGQAGGRAPPWSGKGTIERLGSEHVHGNVHRAVEAQLSA